jgi:hypothetical protein
MITWGRFIAVLVLSGIGPGLALAGGATCSVNDGIWQNQHARTQTALTQAVNTMASTVARESQVTTEQLISAVKVATRQRSVSSGRESSYEKSTAQAVAQVYAAQTSAERIREAHETYGPQGQAVGSCEMIQRLQVVDVALNSIPDRASEVVNSGEIYSAPGSTTTPGEAVNLALAHDVPEAVSAESFMSEDTPDELRTAFMNNVIGLPPVKPERMTRAADRITMMVARRMEAVRSPAIVSLGAIQASREEGGHFDSGDGMSTAAAMDWLISRYGGGREYEEWSAALVTKSEVGLVKEIARLRAINLTLLNTRASSSDRRQAVIAALLGAEAVR